ncbi:hypothetical protein [Streptomyces chartreusis]|uniref:hypothetical protein n=1 Tax=Streptomyces chartreusis TaxID=1969 RepID=UPI0034150127
MRTGTSPLEDNRQGLPVAAARVSPRCENDQAQAREFAHTYLFACSRALLDQAGPCLERPLMSTIHEPLHRAAEDLVMAVLADLAETASAPQFGLQRDYRSWRR